MDNIIIENRYDLQKEKEARAKRLIAYNEALQKVVLNQSSAVIKELVEERHRQGLTQHDMADLTGIIASNIARMEKGASVPTILLLERYASALGKHIEIKVTDGEQ